MKNFYSILLKLKKILYHVRIHAILNINAIQNINVNLNIHAILIINVNLNILVIPILQLIIMIKKILYLVVPICI